MIRDALFSSGKYFFDWMYAMYTKAKTHIFNGIRFLRRWFFDKAPAQVGRIAPQSKPFSVRWMEHFNHTIKTMNKRKF